jgi:hypothetical protein
MSSSGTVAITIRKGLLDMAPSATSRTTGYYAVPAWLQQASDVRFVGISDVGNHDTALHLDLLPRQVRAVVHLDQVANQAAQLRLAALDSISLLGH